MLGYKEKSVSLKSKHITKLRTDELDLFLIHSRNTMPC